MLEVCRPKLREYWRGGCEQPFCVSNTVKRWICEFLVNGDAGAVAEKDGVPIVFTDIRPGVDVDSVLDFSQAPLHWQR
jgi:hypothetical protein